MPPLTEAEVRRLPAILEDPALEAGRLVKLYVFRDFHDTMAFVNAHAWISHREDHHAELTVGHDRCRVAYWTHAIDGLSENDFICAAKTDALRAL